ncbi:MAG: hypothetical protein AAFR61_07955 [Bacteroidota bacterium]
MMSKELLAGLENVKGITNLAELSVLMEALVIRLRELSPDGHAFPPITEVEEQLLGEKLQARLTAYQKGEESFISQEEFIQRIKKRINPSE